MGTLSGDLEKTVNNKTPIGAKEPKVRLLGDVLKQGNYSLEDIPTYQSALSTKVAAGFQRAAHEAGNTFKGAVEIWGGQAALSIGGLTGSETVESFGRSLIKSAYDEIESKDKEFMQKAIQLRPEEYDDFSTALGGGLFNYGGMLAVGYLTGGIGSIAGLSTKAKGAVTAAGGIGSMFALELSGKAQDKLNTYIEKSGDVDFKDYTADIASKDFMFSAMYAAGSAILEKKFGFGEQTKLFKMPFGEKLKNIAKVAISEGGTEFVQSLYETGVDLAGGYIDFSKLPQQFKQALQEGAVGAVLGGGAGIAAAVNHRSQAKQILKESLQNTIPEKDIENVVDAIYEESDGTMRSVIAQELVQSEELRNKRGNLYNQIRDKIDLQSKLAGAYEGVSEAKRAQYLTSTANMLADQVLAEANRRNVTIDDVINASDVRFVDGKFYWTPLTENEIKVNNRKRKKKKTEEVKVKEDELKTQIKENAPAEEKEQNLNDVVSSYEGAENFDVEAMSTDEKQAVFEAEQQVQDSFIEPTYNYQDDSYEGMLKNLWYGDLTEEQEENLKESLDKERDRLAPLFNTAEDVAIQVGDEFGIILTDITDVITEKRLNFKEAESLFGENMPYNDLYLLGEKVKERDNLDGNPYKIGFDYFSQKVYDAFDERVAKSQNEEFLFEYKEKEQQEKLEEQGISEESSEAIQENTLPEVEKKDTTDTDKIEDFGEYIYGARKDLWSGFKDKINKDLPEDPNDIKLSEYFPEPNYEKAIANGVDVNALAFIKAVRDMIPPKPKYTYKLKQWRETVDTLRRFAKEIIDNDFDISVLEKAMEEREFADINNNIKMYQMLGYPYFTKAKGYVIKPMYYHKYNPDGDYVITNIWHEGDKEGYELLQNGRNVSINGSYFFDNLYDAIDIIKNRIDNDSKEKDRKVKFDIYYNTSDRGKIYLGKKIRSGKYVNLHTFNSVKEAREYLANNYDSLVEELNKLKQNPKDRGEVNEARVGEDYRGGADVTPEMFSDMFGFRGVQFGNWVEQKKRIEDLNEAYDALIDLSKIIKIPTRAISLNGTLGLAFGARGHKGAKAHYEPAQVVINLTKMQGAGSLAHEWFHALDNSFMRKTGKNSEFISETANDTNPLSHNRPEVMLAFYNLKNAIVKSKLYERSKEWDMARTNDYWSTIRELGARTFEQYIKDRLASQGTQNDFLVNIWKGEEKDSVYLNEDEKAEIYDAFDKLFDTLKTRETDEGIEFYQVKNLPKQKGKIKGAFDKLTKSIEITSEADFSTYQHEFAHFWLDNMWEYVQSGKASESYKKQFEELKKWLGVKPNQKYYTREQTEKFARGYEKFLFEGTIPNPIIGAVFNDYREFIKEVYESAEDIDVRAGEQYEPLSQEARNFFNIMITGKTEEQTAEKPVEEAPEKTIEKIKAGEEKAEEKPRGLAKTTAEMAKQIGIEVEKPIYEVRSQTDMAKKADEFIKENKQLAIDIVKGLAPEQDGIFRQDLFAALREQALNEGDSDLLNELSRSMTVEEATELGQRIQALARGRINPVKEMVELRDDRMKKNKVTKEKIKEETKKATKEIENEIALAAEPKEWQEFVKSLEC